MSGKIYGNKISKQEFDKLFDQFIEEWRALPWDEWKDKTEHTLEEILHYFNACKERFYVTLEEIPFSALEGKTCLEVGNGFFSAFMHARGVKTTSISKELGMHSVWAGTKGIQTQSVDITKGLPFEDNSFDVIFFCEVMEHVLGYPEEYLTEFCRVLMPGGHLILTTPNLHRISNRIRFFFGRNFLSPLINTPDGLMHIREFDQSEMRDYLKHSGFKEVRVTTYNHYESLIDRLVFQPWSLPNLRRKILAICTK